MRAVLAAVVVMGLAGCGPAGPPSDAQLEVAAQDLVKSVLRDPDSAQFSDLRVSRLNADPVVCGTVNSRNGFGGMAGPERFIAGGKVVLESQLGAGTMAALWPGICGAP